MIQFNFNPALLHLSIHSNAVDTNASRRFQHAHLRLRHQMLAICCARYADIQGPSKFPESDDRKHYLHQRKLVSLNTSAPSLWPGQHRVGIASNCSLHPQPVTTAIAS